MRRRPVHRSKDRSLAHPAPRRVAIIEESAKIANDQTAGWIGNVPANVGYRMVDGRRAGRIRGVFRPERRRRLGAAPSDRPGPEGDRGRLARSPPQAIGGHRRASARRRASRSQTTDRGRTPPSVHHVLRSRRVDRAVDQARRRGPARRRHGLSQVLRGSHRARGRLRRQIHGRRRAGLFRLSAGE